MISIKIELFYIDDAEYKMPTPLNPLIVARLRKYWYKYDKELGELLHELEGWIYILGSGPNMPKCDYCRKDLSLDWRLCKYCPNPTALCHECYQCSACEDAEWTDKSDGCQICGTSCGAYVCRYCRALEQ